MLFLAICKFLLCLITVLHKGNNGITLMVKDILDLLQYNAAIDCFIEPLIEQELR